MSLLGSRYRILSSNVRDLALAPAHVLTPTGPFSDFLQTFNTFRKAICINFAALKSNRSDRNLGGGLEVGTPVTFGNLSPTSSSHHPLQVGRDAASSSAGAKHLMRIQSNEPMLLGRPEDQTGLPVFLYYDGFTRFRQDASNSDLPITPEMEQMAYKFLISAVKIYKSEEDRFEERSLLELMLHHVFSAGPRAQKAVPDGLIRDVWGHYLYILEAKNDIGDGASDPTVQSALSYRKMWSLHMVRRLSRATHGHLRLTWHHVEGPTE